MKRKKSMNREEIIVRPREHEAMLRTRGVAHAALFAGIKASIASLFEDPADVVDQHAF